MCVGSDDECASGQSEFAGDARDRGLLLKAAIGIEDEDTSHGVVDYTPTREEFVFVIGNCLQDEPAGYWGRSGLLPSAPDIIVPSGMSQEFPVWLGFCERGRLYKNCPGMMGRRNAPEDPHRTGHDIP